MTMKTREQVLAELGSREACLDGRDRVRLADFFPVSDWPALGVVWKGDPDQAPPEPTPWTSEAIIEQMRADVSFGFEKALGRRGISASLMHQVVQMWLWILDDPVAADLGYAQYGLPVFKAVAVKYGFDNPIGDASGTEWRFSEGGR